MEFGLPARSPRARVLNVAAVAAFIGIVCVLITPYLPFFRVAENWTGDIRLTVLAQPHPLDQKIVVVRVTEETLAGLAYRSPLDRGFLAGLVRSLEATEARLIGLDILLDRATEPQKDQELRETLLALETPVVVASAFAAPNSLTSAQSSHLRELLSDIPTADVTVVKDLPDGVIRRAYLGSATEPAFAAAIALALGHDLPDGSEITLDYRMGRAKMTHL